MLSVSHINTYYGEVQALYDVSLEIYSQEIVAVIGSNGAGKSTLMKSIMGQVPIHSGEICFNDEKISGLSGWNVVKKGIIYIPEGREVFPNMTVLENLEMGAYSKSYNRRQMNEHLDYAYELFPRLQERKHQKAGLMSGGEQQMLAIARGLMSDPKLLMCDEPSLGLAPVIVDEMFDTLCKVNRERHIPIVIVEQNAYMALTISNRAYVFENGHMVQHGESRDLLNSSDIKKAYLGG